MDALELLNLNIEGNPSRKRPSVLTFVNMLATQCFTEAGRRLSKRRTWGRRPPHVPPAQHKQTSAVLKEYFNYQSSTVQTRCYP
ncbi:hypothetical protein E2C01_039365 [Portunus trituberculatus]|uniref:Uncharacterized protein n=1 Tax=Portunus trituberculatus TaxID=210409 RepID=A0A5B7FKK8_PORTR|nr:hypothetical protein [Portunus trituberculatus]